MGRYVSPAGRWFGRISETLRMALVVSIALWAVTVVLGIRGGWGQNGQSVSFDALIALGLVVLGAGLLFVATREQTPRKPWGAVRRLTGLWAVGFSWVVVLWFPSQKSAPAFLYAWFAIGILLGWILIGAFGILIELIRMLVPRRSLAITVLVVIEAAIVRWIFLPLDFFYISYPWGSVLDAKHSPIMPFGSTVVSALDHAWPIAAWLG